MVSGETALAGCSLISVYNWCEVFVWSYSFLT